MNRLLSLSILFLLFQSACAQGRIADIEIIEIDGAEISVIQEVQALVKPYSYHQAINLSDLSVAAKKQAFINLMLPSILIAKHQIAEQRSRAEDIIKNKGNLSPEEGKYLSDLKKTYRCKKDRDLLIKLQTHPTSIVLAQAAIESGWGTSRFYLEANNVFGIWSYNSKEPRVKASEGRDGQDIYVKKFDSLSEAMLGYFKVIARGPYARFRAMRETSSKVSDLIPYLNSYSELGDEYISRLANLIQFNNLERFDAYQLEIK